mgnify:CR=1 FL=1
MYCTNCGNKIDELVKFCPSCGTEVKQTFGHDALNGSTDSLSEVETLSLFSTFKKVMFQKYATFSGRASAEEFWWFMLAYGLVNLTNYVIFYFMHVVTGENIYLIISVIMNILFGLITIIPTVSLSVRRLHDINRSGWWNLMVFTLIGIIPLIIMYLLKGNKFCNKYGEKLNCDSGLSSGLLFGLYVVSALASSFIEKDMFSDVNCEEFETYRGIDWCVLIKD